MDSATTLAADKKRNKLGYHRTSVACVHCRRRKIRCLLAPDDAQGRCENCIRLKKECNFFPVDQQPPVEKRSRSGSKLESVSTDPSTTSSPPPSFPGGNMIEQPEMFYQYPPAMSFNSNQEMSSFNATTPRGAPLRSDPASTHSFNPDPSLNRQAPWDNTALFNQPIMSDLPGKPDPASILWSQGGSAMSPIPHTSPALGVPINPESHAQAMNSKIGLGIPQHGGSLWPLQTANSMALQNTAGMTPDYPNQYQQHIQTPNPNNNPFQGLNPSIPELLPGQVPVSFDPTQSTATSFGYPPWNSTFSNPSNQAMVGTAPDALGGWYAEQLQFPRTRGPE